MADTSSAWPVAAMRLRNCDFEGTSLTASKSTAKPSAQEQSLRSSSSPQVLEVESNSFSPSWSFKAIQYTSSSVQEVIAPFLVSSPSWIIAGSTPSSWLLPKSEALHQNDDEAIDINMDHNDGTARSDGFKPLGDSPPQSRSRSRLSRLLRVADTESSVDAVADRPTTPGPSSTDCGSIVGRLFKADGDYISRRSSTSATTVGNTATITSHSAGMRTRPLPDPASGSSIIEGLSATHRFPITAPRRPSTTTRSSTPIEGDFISMPGRFPTAGRHPTEGDYAAVVSRNGDSAVRRTSTDRKSSATSISAVNGGNGTDLPRRSSPTRRSSIPNDHRSFSDGVLTSVGDWTAAAHRPTFGRSITHQQYAPTDGSATVRDSITPSIPLNPRSRVYGDYDTDRTADSSDALSTTDRSNICRVSATEGRALTTRRATTPNDCVAHQISGAGDGFTTVRTFGIPAPSSSAGGSATPRASATDDVSPTTCDLDTLNYSNSYERPRADDAFNIFEPITTSNSSRAFGRSLTRRASGTNTRPSAPDDNPTLTARRYSPYNDAITRRSTPIPLGVSIVDGTSKPDDDEIYVVGSASSDDGSESVASATTQVLASRRGVANTPSTTAETAHAAGSHYRPALERLREDPEPPTPSRFAGRHAELRRVLDQLNQTQGTEITDEEQRYLSTDNAAPLGSCSTPLADMAKTKGKGRDISGEDLIASRRPRAPTTTRPGLACPVESAPAQPTSPTPETAAGIANLRRGPVIRYGLLPLAGKPAAAANFGLLPPREIRALWPGIDRMRNLSLALLVLTGVMLLSLLSSISVVLKGIVDEVPVGNGLVVWATLSGAFFVSSGLGLAVAIWRYVRACRRAEDGEGWITAQHLSRPLPPPPSASSPPTPALVSSPSAASNSGGNGNSKRSSRSSNAAAVKGQGKETEGGKVVLPSVSRRELLQPEEETAGCAGETAFAGEGNLALPRADTQASILTVLCAAVTEGYSPLSEELRAGASVPPPAPTAMSGRLSPRPAAVSEAEEEDVEMF